MSISRLGPRKWRIVWESGNDPKTGRRHQKIERFSGSKEKAIERYVERQKELNDGIGLRDHVSIADLAEEWILHKQEQGRKPETIRGYRDMIDHFIVPVLGCIVVEDLTVLDVQRAVRYWRNQPRRDTRQALKTLSARRVQYAFRTLSTMLEDAVRWDIVARNVARKVEAPTVAKKEARWWTAEEAKRFLEAAQEHMHGIVFVLALLTGMRRGEILGLRWSDIDWDRSVIRVGQVQDARHPKLFHTPKTDAGMREISLDPMAIDLLKAQRAAQNRQRLAVGGAWEDWGLVCCTGRGTPHNPSNLNRTMDRLIAATGVPRIKLHDLRHTHGALFLAVEPNIRILANRLGHTQVSFTIQTYGHAKVEAQAKPAAAVSAALFGHES